MAAPQESTGLTISFTGFTADIIGLTPPTTTVDDLETTHMGTTGYRTYIAGVLKEGGALEAEILWDPDVEPPFGVIDTLTLTFSDGGTLVFDGYINSESPSAPIRELMKATVSIKVADDVTRAVAP
jgi:hypothetical protein